MGKVISDRTLKVLAEPLLHFTLIGVAVFAIAGTVVPDSPAVAPDDTLIEITAEDLDRLSMQFASTWNRPPTDAEITGLLESLIREEVLYREALALGLDDGDAIIRQRLRLKMEFFGEAVAAAMTPDEQTLAAWYAEHADDFTPPPRISLRQITLAAPEDAASVLAALEGGVDPGTLGQPTLLPSAVDGGSQLSVDGMFGPGVFDTVTAQPVGIWQGPVASSFGWHLFLLLAIDRPEAPPLAEVQDAVIAAWRQAQAETLREAQYDTFRARYDIRLPEAPE
jgi:parvulin-like peptidyl-prolyl isomerase